jgi:hypothetical protein
MISHCLHRVTSYCTMRNTKGLSRNCRKTSRFRHASTRTPHRTSPSQEGPLPEGLLPEEAVQPAVVAHRTCMTWVNSEQIPGQSEFFCACQQEHHRQNRKQTTTKMSTHCKKQTNKQTLSASGSEDIYVRWCTPVLLWGWCLL